MGTKKVRVETILDDGTKIVVSIKGSPNREKLSKYFDLLELMGTGIGPNLQSNTSQNLEKASLFEQVMYIINLHLFGHWFNIEDIAKVFEKERGFAIRRSTLATYLSRLLDQGILVRDGTRGSYRYSLNIMKKYTTHNQLIKH